MPEPLASPLLYAWRNAWRPHDRRPIYEWAADNVILPAAYGIRGAFHVEQSRYLIEPFHAIADDSVRIVTVRAGIQTGKSLLGDITVCHCIVTRPMHLLWNFPTDEAADDYANRRAGPLLEACPPVAEKFAKLHRHKKRKNEILFGPMFIALQGANIRNLQTYTIPFLINEELWEWDPGMYQQALGRTAFFSWRSKVINLSQAGELGDDLDQEYEAGSQEVWHILCEACRTYQPIHWNITLPERDGAGRPKYAGMIWDSNEHTKPNGRYHFERLKSTVRYRCPHCGHEIADTPRERRLLNDTGKHVARNHHAAHDKRSFHWNSMACVEVRWATLAEEFLRAKAQEKLGNRIPLQEFYKKRISEPFNIEKHSSVDLLPTVKLELDASRPISGTGRQPVVVDGIPFIHRLAAVDVQQDHFWMLIQLWSAVGDILNLWAGKLYSWTEIAGKQNEHQVWSEDLCVDIGHRRFEVIRQCVLYGQARQLADGRAAWFPWKGLEDTDRPSFAHKIKRGKNAGKTVLLPYSEEQKADPCIGLAGDDPSRLVLQGRRCPIYRWSSPWINDIVIDRRDGMSPGVKFLTAAGDWNEEFSRQMHSQKKSEINNKLGQGKWKWVKFRDDHLFNCAGMNMVRAFQLRILGDGAEAE